MDPTADSLPPRPKISPAEIPEIIFDTAIESAVRAFLLVLMGGIALSIVGGLCSSMAPTLPFGLKGGPVPHSLAWKGPVSFFSDHKFIIVFAILFSVTFWLRMTGHGEADESGTPRTRLQHIGHQLSEEWFGLIVGNAFGAMISAFVLVWVQQFSLSKLLLNAVLGAVFGFLGDLLRHLTGAGPVDGIARLWDWYGANQMKFTFWILYVGAICDDLGLPNVKTLGRFLWTKVRRREIVPPPVVSP